MGISQLAAAALARSYRRVNKRFGGRPGGRPSRDYEVRPLERSEFGRWDEFVRQSPQGTLFHSTLWLEASSVPFKLFGCFRGEELRGGFAAAIGRGRTAGHPHPALTPYLGLLLPKSDGKYVAAISVNKGISAAFAAFLTKEFDSVQFRCPPEIIDLQPFIWAGFQAGLRYTYRLPTVDLDAVLENMDKSRRRDIANAQRNGLWVEEGADFSLVVRLSEKTFTRQGLETGFRDAAFGFQEKLRNAGRCQGFVTRDLSGQPVAGVWIVWDENRAYGLISGYDDAVESSSAVSLALWRSIEYIARDLNLREFDFEGSMIPGIEQFFRKFGATLMPTYTIKFQKPEGLPQRVARGFVARLRAVRR
jgi:hypothetical protein